jgi:tetratricopeptide (TPR) repeat protein
VTFSKYRDDQNVQTFGNNNIDRWRNAGIRADARTPFALGVLAEELRGRGKFPEAEACYRRAMELAEEQQISDGTLADLKIALAQVLSAQRKLRQAEVFLREAIQLAKGGHVDPMVGQSAQAELQGIVRKRRRFLIKTALAVTAFVAVATLAAFATDISDVAAEAMRVKPRNEVITKAAFDAYNQGDYETARDRADECICEYREDAEQLQALFVEEGTPKPPQGSVTRHVRLQILKNGLLNDVASCLWLKGRCAQKLGRTEEARRAFEQSMQLYYARCWDPNLKTFWSPPRVAGCDLARMETQQE